MINTELFNAIIDKKQLTNLDLSLQTGITANRIVAIRSGKSDPNSKEIQAFSEVMSLTDRQRRAVFFNRNFVIRL